jgi:nucleoid DNA-binding protein
MSDWKVSSPPPAGAAIKIKARTKIAFRPAKELKEAV